MIFPSILEGFQDEQYSAVRAKDGSWTILDKWHSSIKGFEVSDEIPNDSPAITKVSEGQFLAVVKEAYKAGFLTVAPKISENQAPIESIQEQVDKAVKEAVKEPVTPKSESLIIKEQAMAAILKLVGMDDIKKVM